MHSKRFMSPERPDDARETPPSRPRREAGPERGSRDAFPEGPTQGARPASYGIFPEDYDQFIPPSPGDGSPLPVVFSVKVREILDINEPEMDITIEWYIRMYWTDARLRPPMDSFTNSSVWVNIDPALTSRMWLPTTYIDHVKEIRMPSLLILPHSLRIATSGLMRYSMSVITKLACPMDFSAYPFDQQKCYMKLESYQYRAFEVTYSWHENGIQTSSDIRTDHFIPAFQIIKGSIVHDNASFSSVRVDIILSRKATYHLMNTYIPSSLFVFVSWLTFLIPPEHLPGRTVLTITTLLTIVSMFNTVRQESPKVSYAKAIDQWMMFCIVLVFAVLVEYTYVVHLHFRAEQLRLVSVEPKRDARQVRGTSSARKVSTT
ncbi:gamma-aminobutyric acid receptor subunit beta-3-like [Penaeus monodon]|uniref:gamma-aminobutyric acid receptor subunit beta-3-like n=1 Tax=Penaeus monodon TaxID=6687 RepID=UPI0018A78D47|nr:gamma-aminobutyric acid receptor subunit beta-3-like [Penaeus monodon]